MNLSKSPILLPARAAALSLFAGAMLLSGAADARPRILIDFAGEAGGVSSTSGDSWVLTSNATVCGLDSTAPASCGITFVSKNSVATKLGFQVNIGGVTYDSLFVNSNGFITFGSPKTGNFVAAATIPDLQQVITANGSTTRPFIAPLYRQMSIPDVPVTSFAPFGGGASYFRATGDPLAPFNVAERVPAFAVTWIDSDFNLDPQVLTQLVLYSAGANGDFYLRLRYGQSDNVQYSGLAGGSLVTGLATDVFQLASTLGGPTANLNDYLFVFRNGALVPSIDTDADGVLNGVDNCRMVVNADQRDTNGDGYGNLCDPDFNNNGIVDSQDGALLKAAFGSGALPDRDLNGNNIVDSQDGAILKARFGQAPGPSGFKP